MKFGGIVDSGSGELLTFEKIPKNQRWPPAPRRPFCIVGFSVTDTKSISSYGLYRIFLKLGTLTCSLGGIADYYYAFCVVSRFFHKKNRTTNPILESTH